MVPCAWTSIGHTRTLSCQASPTTCTSGSSTITQANAVAHCEDEFGAKERACGEQLSAVDGRLPIRYATVCGLRPKRKIRLTVEAFNCDEQVSFVYTHSVTPPSAPNVVATLVTEPAAQESAAGFRPRAVLDWIPQHSDLIVGHAVYLGLVQVAAMKLLCFVPRGDVAFAQGHLELPILHKNHTYSEHTELMEGFINRFHVHQEQEVLVSTRIVGALESPLYSFRLGEWLVMDEELKCLTSFGSTRLDYVEKTRALSWTQEQAMSVFG